MAKRRAPRSGSGRAGATAEPRRHVPPTTALPHVDGVSHRWVEARGLLFHVAEAGTGADVVLLLHGWPQHWYEWRHLMPALAHDHRVLALDLRGFGWSDAPGDGYAKEDMATDVLAVLDALGLDRVKLVGHDWGGWIGLRAFSANLAEPARARACVQVYRTFVLREALGVAAGRHAAGRLRVPTLLLFGTGDLAQHPGLLAGCERNADSLRVELVAGCGHFIADERPELVAAAARGFLA